VGAEVFWLAVFVVAVLLANLIRLMRGYGQGGALRERAGVETHLTGGLADNARWIWGIFYVDRDDPSIMVEERFGLGYTFNYGNRTAILITVAFVALALSVIALIIGTSVTGG